MKYAYAPLVGYRSRKAAQAAAKFVCAEGSKIEKLKLIKLMYLAERESIRSRGRPMFYDELFSLKDGPICSSTLNAINGGIDKEIWAAYIQKNGDKDIYLVSGNNGHDELSRSDLAVIESIIRQFGWMTSSQIRNWTHNPRNCPEYTEVENNSRLPIAYGDVAVAVGHDDAAAFEASIKEYRHTKALDA